MPEDVPAPRTAGGSETCCDVFFFVGGDSWPESESAESESVPDRFLAALEDADEDDAEEEEEDDEPDEEVDEDDNVLWMVVGSVAGFGRVRDGFVAGFGRVRDGSVSGSSRASC